MAFEFIKYPKTARLLRNIVITEKLDGTNAAVIVTPDGQVGAQSRNRIINPQDDNMGFAGWVEEHKEKLADVLGAGHHFGEWWGSGIQRGYGLEKGDKRFSLFNTGRWGHFADPEQAPGIPGLGVVPVLDKGTFNTAFIIDVFDALEEAGSQAAPGFTDPEGIIIYHSHSNSVWKMTFDGDLPKGGTAAIHEAA